MMRSILAISALTLLWIFCTPISAQPREPAPKGLPREVFGQGDTPEQAKESAMRVAEKTVADLMAMHGLSHFKPDSDFIRRHVIAKSGQAGEDIEVDNDPQPLKKWVLPLRTDNDWWGEIVRLDRAESRQALTSRIMIGISILLLAGVGYIRLDEYTH